MRITAEVIFFLLWVNFLPPFAHLLLGKRLDRPVDGGLLFFDKQPLFGRHKTLRGIIFSVVGGSALAFLLSLTWWVVVLAAFAAMLGDLLSSFVKRRLHKKLGSSIFFLDQIFESLFPLLVIHYFHPMFWWQFVSVLLVFIPLAFLGACFWQYISSHPHQEDYPRLIRSTVRFREWRSCHEPLARWQTVLNLTSFLSDQVLLTFFFKVTGLYERGKRNALDMRVEQQTFHIDSLPAAFDGFKILLLSDLHLDGLEGLTDQIIQRVQGEDVDVCLVGGDVRMKTYGRIAPSLRHLRRLMAEIKSKQGFFGVLGNHDCIEMTPDFEEAGITMLINDCWPVKKGSERIWLVGVDDPHYYRTHNVSSAFQGIPKGESVIFLAHSPEAYDEAAEHGACLYLCGHTHGGQICLPGSGPLITNSRAPRFTASGKWSHRSMHGYTTRGVGPSGVPLRFNCPGEISLITLRVGSSDN